MERMDGMGWKRLCCPIDFSEEARAALRVAIDLCRRFGAELTLLHVQDRNAQVASPPANDPHLREWRADAESAGVRVAAAEETGDPKDRIVEFANDRGFDLVVMGTKGATGRDRVLVGSVAESVVRRARCPVLTVHAPWAPAGA